MASLLAIFALIAINAFFVIAEFSIVSVRRSRIQQLVLEGDTQARTVQNLQRDINRLLSTTQIGITLSCLALGWIAEKIVSSVVAKLVAPLGYSVLRNNSFIHSLAILSVFLLLAYLQIVLGELGPKSLALKYSEGLSRAFGPLSLSISKLLAPFVWLLNHSTELLLSAFGIQFSDEELFGQVTTKELQLIVEASAPQTEEQEEDRQLLRNFFEFGEVTVKELMVPRTNVEFFPIDGSYEEFMAQVSASPHDSYPIVNNSLDDVRGVLRVRDLAGAIADRKMQPDSRIAPWIKQAEFVNEDTSIQDALELMLKGNHKILMVVEEDVGGTAGLIHMDDILSVIVNNPDEDEDEVNQDIIPISDMSYSIQGQTSIEELNEELGLQIPIHDEYQTLGGYVLYLLQKVPEENDCFQDHQIEYTILDLDGPRIERIMLRRLPISSINLDLSNVAQGKQDSES